ncbi:MAG: hypothetical protein DLM59_03450 [Pseudonocardiales bacterium]|nr:MAG: hypothetical protein DLM59_03450 [Pseudonocardiales bacterium]
MLSPAAGWLDSKMTRARSTSPATLVVQPRVSPRLRARRLACTRIGLDRSARRRSKLLTQCRAERIETPAAGRIDRIVRSALHQAEQTLTARIVATLPVNVAGRVHSLVAVEVPDDDTGV